MPHRLCLDHRSWSSLGTICRRFLLAPLLGSWAFTAGLVESAPFAPQQPSAAAARDRQGIGNTFQLQAERLRQAVYRRPRAGAVFDRWHDHYLAANRRDEWLTDADQRRQAAADDPHAQLVWGLVNERLGRHAEAASAYATVTQLQPQDAYAWIRLAELHQRAGEKRQALDTYRAALDREVPPAELLPVIRAAAALALQQMDEPLAITFWQQGAARLGTDQRALEEIATQLEQRDKHALAVPLWERIARESRDPQQVLAARRQLALGKLAAGQTADGVEALTQLLEQIDPSGWQAAELRGHLNRALTRQGGTAAVVAYWQAAHARQPNQLHVLQQYAEALVLDGQIPQAIALYRSLIERTRDSRALHDALIVLLVRAEDLPAAIDEAQRVANDNPQDADAWLQLGNLLWQQSAHAGRTMRARALSTWRRAAEANPDDAQVALAVATTARAAAFATEQTRLASQPQAQVSAALREAEADLLAFTEEFYRAAVRRAADGEYGDRLGEFLYRLGRKDEAIAAWKQWAERAPQARWLPTTEWLRSVGELVAATEAAQQACDATPGQLAAWQMLIDLQLRTQHSAAALDAVERLAAQRPQDPDWQQQVLELRIAARTAAGTLDEEITQQRARLALEPNNPQARAGLALLLQRTGGISEAIELLQPLATSDDVSPDVLRQYAALLAQDRQWEPAAAQFTRLLDLDSVPRRDDYRQLAELQLQLTQRDAALATAVRYAQRVPRDAEGQLLLAKMCRACQDEAGALAALRRAAELAPRDFQIRRQLVHALYDAQLPQEGMAQAAKAFELAGTFAERDAMLRWLLADKKGPSDLDTLESILRTLRQSQTQHADDWTQLLVTLLQDTHRPELALAELRELFSQQPTDIGLLQQLVNVAVAAQQLDEAIRYQRMLTQLAPSPGHFERLARLHRQHGQWNEAAAVWDQLLDRSAAESIANGSYESLIDDLVLRGDLYRAQAVVEAAWTGSPQSWTLGVRAALLHMLLEQPDEAQLTWQAVLNSAAPSLVEDAWSDAVATLASAVDAETFFRELAARSAQSGWRHPQTIGYVFDRDTLMTSILRDPQTARIYAAVALAGHADDTGALDLPDAVSVQSAWLAAVWATQRHGLALASAANTFSDTALPPLAELIRLLTPRGQEEPAAAYAARLRSAASVWRPDPAAVAPHPIIDVRRVYLLQLMTGLSDDERAVEFDRELADAKELAELLPLVRHVADLESNARGERVERLVARLADMPLPTDGTAGGFLGRAAQESLTELLRWEKVPPDQRRQLAVTLWPLALPLAADSDRSPTAVVGAGRTSLERAWRDLLAALNRAWQVGTARMTAWRPILSGSAVTGDADRLRAVQLQLALLRAGLPGGEPAPGDVTGDGTLAARWYPVASPLLPARELRLLEQVAALTDSDASYHDLREPLRAWVARSAESSDAERRQASLALCGFDWFAGRRADSVRGLRALQEEHPQEPTFGIQLAGAYLEQQQFAAARDLLQRQPQEDPATGALLRALWAGWTRQLTRHELQGHEGAVTALAISPTGHRLASAGVDGTVRVWDPESGELLHTLRGHADIVLAVTFAADGERLYSGGYDRSVREWDVVDGRFLREVFAAPATVRSLDYDPRTARLAIGGEARMLVVLPETTAAELAEPLTLSGHTDAVLAVRLVAGQGAVMSLGADGTVRRWDLANGSEHSKWTLPDRSGRCLVVDSESAGLSATANGAVTWYVGGEGGQVWRGAGDSTSPPELVTRTRPLRSLAFLPGPAWLAGGRDDHHVELLSAREGQTQLLLTAHAGRVLSVVADPSGRWGASAGYDGAIKIWAIEQP